MTPLILQCDIEAARRMLAEQRSKEDVLEMLVQRRIDPARAERLVSDLIQGINVRPDMEVNDESKPKHGSSRSSSGDESSSDQKRRRRRKHSSSHSSGHSRDKSKAGTLLLFLVLVTILGAAVYFLLIRDTESKAGDAGASQGTNAVTQPSKPASK